MDATYASNSQYTATAPQASPLSISSEMPTTSHSILNQRFHNGYTPTAPPAPSSDDWVRFDNSMDDATTLSASNLKQQQQTNDDNNTKASSTAYSFTGSALYNDATATDGGGPTINLKASSTTTDNNANNSNTANTTSTNQEKKDEEEKSDDSLYECNICLDTAKDAVVSLCGHLFCWPCLHQWLETRPNRKLCPVCKAAVDKDKVIPLYGRNSQRQNDPRNKVPPRPAGQRTEPEPQAGFPGFGFGDGFHMSFGIGAFPFGFFTSSLNFGEPRPAAANRGTTQYEDEQTLSKLFLYLAFMCIAWLLFA